MGGCIAFSSTGGQEGGSAAAEADLGFTCVSSTLHLMLTRLCLCAIEDLGSSHITTDGTTTDGSGLVVSQHRLHMSKSMLPTPAVGLPACSRRPHDALSGGSGDGSDGDSTSGGGSGESARHSWMLTARACKHAIIAACSLPK